MQPTATRRKQAFAVLLLLCGLLPAAAAPPSPEAGEGSSPSSGTVTLSQAIAEALARSPRLAEARSQIARARARGREARAEGRPELTGSAGGQLQGPARSQQGATITPSRASEAGVDLAVPLYTGGRVRAGKRAAAGAEQAARARQEAEAQRLVLDVTEAYLGCLEALQEMELQGALRALNQERLRVGRVRLDAGVGASLEVTQAEADLADAVQGEIEAEARLKQASATLNTLIGRPAEATLELAPLPELTPAIGASSPEPGAAPPLEELTSQEARALGRERPDLRAVRADVRSAGAEVERARAARRPLLSLGGNVLQKIPETLLGGFAWSLGSSLVQSLFDGGRSRARVEAARAERARIGAHLAEAERLADEQVEQARVALEAAEKRLTAEDQRVTAARAALDVARKRRDAGTSAAIEVTEAEAVVARARTGALAARFACARARVRLAYAAGVAYP